MKMNLRTTVARILGSILLSGLVGQTAYAQLTPGGTGISGASVLADVNGANTGPEALIVDWSVVENLSDVYTYSYNVYNPPLDVLLDGGGSEIVVEFSVGFNNAPGTILSQSGAVIEGLTSGIIGGAEWYPNFYGNGVVAGTYSGELTLTSSLPPSAGNGQANDANPPSPWNSYPDGQALPVPGTGNFIVPDSASTFSLLGGVIMLLPFSSVLKKAVRK